MSPICPLISWASYLDETEARNFLAGEIINNRLLGDRFPSGGALSKAPSPTAGPSRSGNGYSPS